MKDKATVDNIYTVSIANNLKSTIPHVGKNVDSSGIIYT
jgi:hypothetical protein